MSLNVPGGGVQPSIATKLATEATGNSATELSIAQMIWHRFANANTQTWDEETHQAEYLICARDILRNVSTQHEAFLALVDVKLNDQKKTLALIRDELLGVGGSAPAEISAHITQEMAIAGSLVLDQHGVAQGNEQLAIQIYRSMASVSGARPWQPIETAPRDGTDFIAWGKLCGLHVAYWSHWFDNLNNVECEGWRDTNSVARLSDITHWMPLPLPPSPSSTSATATETDGGDV